MEIKKFSKKQAEILKFAYSDEPILLCDGAVRSGKTLAMSFAFVLWAMSNFDRTNFAICGKTVASAERNILRPLEQIEGVPWSTAYKISNRCLTVRSGSVENHFYLFGGKDESSYSLIQGLTLAGVLFDEVALMPQSFVDQAIARTLSFSDAKIWFNCNPESPTHWFYREWVSNEKRVFKYLHFLMEDNPILTKKEIKKAEKLFAGAFYDRYILGLWKRAEGLVFTEFAEHTDEYLLNASECPTRFSTVGVGYDLGGNKSNFALVAAGITYDHEVVVLKANEIIPQELSLADVEQAAKDFIIEIEQKYNCTVDFSYIDDNYWTTVNSLNNWRYIFGSASKIKSTMPLTDRPLMLTKLMAEGRFKLIKGECEPLVWQLQNAVFDAKSEKTVICDNGSMNIDAIDALFYSIAEDYLFLTN